MPRIKRHLLIILCCSVVTLAVAFKLAHFWVGGSGGALHTVFYEVKSNESPQHVVRDLAKAGVISDPRLFYWYARFTGQTKLFKSGDYRFTTKMWPDEILSILTSGVSWGFPLTVPEGYNIRQVAQVVEGVREGSGGRFLKLCRDRKFIAGLGIKPVPETLEGYLFPDTYTILRHMTEEEMVRHMVKRFFEVYTQELSVRAKELKMSDRQILTLASMIEKETGATEERPMISSVFHNRLKKRMRLASDPTVIYGLGDSYSGNIHKSDLQNYTPYNTYRIPGLPPGPIANPGKEAILAALYPVESKYLYFVSHNDGTHEFTSTYEDHMRAVDKFQLHRKAREGRSWRELSKRARNGVAPSSDAYDAHPVRRTD